MGNDIFSKEEIEKLKAEAKETKEEFSKDPAFAEYFAKKDGGKRIEAKNRVSNDRGFVERALTGLDYLGNISRTFIKTGLTDHEDLLLHTYQALQNKRYTSPTEVKDAITEKLGIARAMRFGDDDGKFQIGDIGDFMVDFSIDLATDPLNWLSWGGLGLIKKGLGATKPLFNKNALKLMKSVGIGSKEVLGGMYGYAISNPDDDWTTKMRNTALGVGMVRGGRAAFPLMKEIVKNAGSASIEAYNLKYKGIRGAGQAFEHIADAQQKLNRVATMIGKNYEDVVKGLDSTEQVALFRILNAQKSRFLKARNKLIRKVKLGEKPITKSQMKVISQKLKNNKGLNEAESMAVDEINSITKQLNAEMSTIRSIAPNDMKKILHNVEPKDLKNVLDMADEWGATNLKVMKFLRESTDKATEGMRWHVDTSIMKDHLDELEEVIYINSTDPMRFARGTMDEFGHVKDASKLPMQYVLSDPDRQLEIFNIYQGFKAKHPDLSPSQIQKLWLKSDENKAALNIIKNIKLKPEAIRTTHEQYVRNFSKNFLDKTEREAIRIVNKVKATTPNSPSVAKWENSLRNYDELHSFVKTNMLGATLTWVRTNAFDNMMKAYVERGLLTGAKTNPAFALALGRKLEPIASGKEGVLKTIFKDADREMYEYAVKSGAIDGNLFKQATERDQELKNIFYAGWATDVSDDPTKFIKMVKKNTKHKGAIAKIAQKELDILRNTTMRWGGDLERGARYITFEHVLEDLTKKKGFKSFKSIPTSKEKMDLANEAHSIVAKTFFDYNKLTGFEQKVMKRIAPFYAFYSKNLPYWLETAVNPEKIGRLANVDRIRRNIGDKPSEHQYEGMAEYVKEAAPRFISRGKKGNEFFTMPYSSYMDAAKMANIMELDKSITEKLSPFIKTPVEYITNSDLFTGGTFYPAKGEKKYLFSAGRKYKFAADLLKKAGIKVDWIDTDSKGNPYTTSKNLILINKLLQTILPAGGIDVAAQAGYEISEGGSPLEELSKIALPYKKRIISHRAAAYLRRQRKRKKK